MLFSSVFSSVSSPASQNQTTLKMPVLKGDEAISHLKEKGSFESLSEAYQATRYSIDKNKTGATANNPSNALQINFNYKGLQLSSTAKEQNWTSNWSLSSFSYGENQTTVSKGELQTNGNRVELKRDGQNLTEWFVNETNGVEHGFTLAERPAGTTSNLISDNSFVGISLQDKASNSIIVGNLIGTKANGTEVLPNEENGILVDSGANNNLIGNDTIAGRNIIGGHNVSGFQAGIVFLPDAGSNNRVVGNLIGVARDEQTPLPNQNGIIILADGQIIGSQTGRNIIGFNLGDLLTATSTDAAGNSSEFTPAFTSPVALVTVSGRVFSSGGIGLPRAIVVMTNSNGSQRMAQANSFGYNSFDNVPAGITYTFSIESKQHSFASQVINIQDNLTNLNFTAQTKDSKD